MRPRCPPLPRWRRRRTPAARRRPARRCRCECDSAALRGSAGRAEARTRSSSWLSRLAGTDGLDLFRPQHAWARIDPCEPAAVGNAIASAKLRDVERFVGVDYPIERRLSVGKLADADADRDGPRAKEAGVLD